MTDAALSNERILQALRQARAAVENVERSRHEPIAIVGIGCRLPGGIDDADSYWLKLCDGLDAVGEVPAERWDNAAIFDADRRAAGKTYSGRGAFIPLPDQFDAEFFGISPREAARLDPQQRLLLECAWEALEDAGLAGRTAGQSGGVYIGIGQSHYGDLQLTPEHLATIDTYSGTGSLLCFASGRLSHWLGLDGPSLSIDTACSSSLVAVHLACQSLRSGETRLALAGGVHLNLAPHVSVFLSRAGVLAPDGRSKAFDAAADGFGRGEGCAVIVLKRLSDALADGDIIHALIRGTAVNHDGASAGLTVPNEASQAKVIRDALHNARLDAAQVGFVETHGTGTELGDPIEARALGQVFAAGHNAEQPLYLGAVKSSIGHLEAAAGLAGLLKAALAVKYGQIPVQSHFHQPNPHIPWYELPLAIPRHTLPWPAGYEKRIAGISAFGMSGTNAHVVLEAPPAAVDDSPASNDRPRHLLALSARSEAALRAMAGLYREHLAIHPEQSLADVCLSAATGRGAFEHRLALACASKDEASALLEEFEHSDVRHSEDPAFRPPLPSRERVTAIKLRQRFRLPLQRERVGVRGNKRPRPLNSPHPALSLRERGPQKTAPGLSPAQSTAVGSLSRGHGTLFWGRAPRDRDGENPVFLFTGQGSQYWNMGRELYQTQPGFRASLERCAAVLDPLLEKPLLDVLYGSEADAGLIDRTDFTQPALFSLQYALAELWQSWGIRPAAVLGHSLGEYAAACVAGVFSLEDGLKLVAARGRLMRALPGNGAMAALLCQDAAALADWLAQCGEDVVVSGYNSPRELVVAGSQAAVQAVLQRLAEQGTAGRQLAVSHAFHSPLMAPMLDQFAPIARSIAYTAPRLDMLSAVDGGWNNAATADYWCRQILEPVRFSKAMAELARHGHRLFLEIGPRPILSGLGRANLPGEERSWLASLDRGQDDWDCLLHSLGRLFCSGVAFDGAGFDRDYARRRVRLPSYPFQRSRHWLEPPARPAPVPTMEGRPLAGRRLALPGCPDIRYETRLEPAHCAALRDHHVFGSLVVAGAYHLATVLEAASQALGTTRLRLEDIRLPRALAIPDGSACRLQVLLEPAEGGGYRFRTLSCADGLDANDDAAWVTHVSGKLYTVGYAPRTAAPIGAQCAPYELNAEAFYTELSTIGFDLGPSYRWTQRIEQHDGQIRCRLQTPQQWDAQNAALHPGLLDTCFQILSRFWPATPQQMLASGTLYVPFAIAAVELHRFPGDASQALLCRAVKETTDTDGSELTVAAGLSLETENGEPLLRVEGFQFRRTGRDALLAGLRGPMDEVLALDWTPLAEAASPAPTAQQQWLILADQGGLGLALAEQLQRLGHGCQVVAADEDLQQIPTSAWDGVAYLRGLDNPLPSDAAALQTTLLAKVAEVQALLRRLTGTAPRLWLVTRGGQVVNETTAGANATAISYSASSPRQGMPGPMAKDGARDTVSAPSLAMDFSFAAAAVGNPCRNDEISTTLNSTVVPTRVALAQAPLWGLFAVLASEHANLKPSCIDLPPTASADDAAWLAEALLQAGREDWLAVRAGRRYAARLRRHDAGDHAPTTIRPDAAYLITGGLGGLGLKLAGWLVEQGARCLVLNGRSEPSPEAQSQLEQLRRQGAQVHCHTADIADAEQAAALFALMDAGLPPLRGVFHAAGVLQDGLLLQQTPQQLAAVFAPKLAGAWHLHKLTEHRTLDFLVLFASAATLIGARGQAGYAMANAFLDALARTRRAQGLPALSLDWGAWAEAGMGARLPDKERQRWTERGFGTIAPQRGLDILGSLLGSRSAQLAVLPIDKPALLAGWAPPRFDGLFAKPAFSVRPELVEGQHNGLRQGAPEQSRRTQPERGENPAIDWQPIPPEQRLALLESRVRLVVAATLGIKAPESIEPRARLFDLGFDSILALEAAEKLAKALGIALHDTLIFEYPTLEALVDYLARTCRIGPAETEDSSAAEPAFAPLEETDIAALSDEEAERLLLAQLKDLAE